MPLGKRFDNTLLPSAPMECASYKIACIRDFEAV